MRGGRRTDPRGPWYHATDHKVRSIGMATVERISAGTALPARLYRDPEVLELERKRIFERTWQLAGHVSQLPKPGTYVTAKAGTQPVLVLRDEEGVLRAFRNVCRHRGS